HEVWNRNHSGHNKPKQARSHVSVKQVMFELVLVASKTPIARTVAVIRALLENVKGTLKKRDAELTCTLRESSSAGERVIKIDLRLSAVSARRRERRPVLSLEFVRFEFQERAS